MLVSTPTRVLSITPAAARVETSLSDISLLPLHPATPPLLFCSLSSPVSGGLRATSSRAYTHLRLPYPLPCPGPSSRRHTPQPPSPASTMFRNLKSLLSYSRVPVRIAAQQEKHKLFRVRFVPQDRRLNGFVRAFLILSGIHVAANTMLQIFGGGWEEPLFIPLGFAQAEPLKRYEASDPDFQAYVKFNQDKKKVLAARSESFPFPPPSCLRAVF